MDENHKSQGKDLKISRKLVKWYTGVGEVASDRVGIMLLRYTENCGGKREMYAKCRINRVTLS